ncbi:MAG: DnaB-like helicase C-terminal domain-containing protein [Candidatus Poseidoniales archaeon]|jgi:replicative DNA helicase
MIEELILTNLAMNEKYSRRVLPFIDVEYFSSKHHKIAFKVLKDHIDKYNELPSRKSLLVDLQDIENISDDNFRSIQDIFEGMSKDEEVDNDWLVDTTEKFCQDKAIYNALMKSIEIVDDKAGDLSKGSIPKILTDALSVSFDGSIGHDFFADYKERFDFYHRKEERIPFDLEYMNIITKGGFPKKSLNIFLAGTNVGKSLAMCHCAASNLADGKNVLYITLEMAEERISERIDANLLDIAMDEIQNLNQEKYFSRMERLKSKTSGRLVVKEYPTASANANHFRVLLNELKIKKNFMPDIIYIDYLNICTSARVKPGSNMNSYGYIKSIAEELRGLSAEFGPPVVSATQTTRSGFVSSDIGLEDTSESFGLPATADFMVALIRTDELDELGQIMVKQLKNRYGDPSKNKRFVVGVDMTKMRLYDVDSSAHNDVMDSPVFDNTNTAEKFNMDKFKDFM